MGRVKASKLDENHPKPQTRKCLPGDMVRGSDLVVTAIAEGRDAAQGILNYLGLSAFKRQCVSWFYR